MKRALAAALVLAVAAILTACATTDVVGAKRVAPSPFAPPAPPPPTGDSGQEVPGGAQRQPSPQQPAPAEEPAEK